ncbi:hypothetical protein DFP92_11189 [Yoonia sediminilitoris]|uniref:DUF6455 domain-containing protein n=2 Tax=Yoonia sediminilitoris TaxID=1286148 RepID=A0A2T6KBB4_9RHOB|nr:hypothetical protein C8N45_11190 [Yoonia sediminilitoris]RCW92940.1 hypothetical protein DFP92_11189 [Yoonia sediminilitoris]
MKPMGEPRKHYWQVLKMANATGTPLQAAFEDGDLGSADFADLITKCQRCPQPEKCSVILDRVRKLPDTPDFCPNRETYARLRRQA